MSVKRVYYIKNGEVNFKDVSFKWSGTAAPLHSAFLKEENKNTPLEVSSFSSSALGRALSAFNLTFKGTLGWTAPVECVFQSGKIFAEGGPFTSLRWKTALDSKREIKDLASASGPLVGFVLEGRQFPLEPTTLFYNWVWINALASNPANADLSKQLLVESYDAFTDIAFNHNVGRNTQAEAAAYFVLLSRTGRLEEALKSPEDFSRIVYGD